ncbi:MAG: hypothetical protein KIS68_11970 [Bauldia sp.]|nr:hypothetical protein [Bauldia sp.]
MTTSLDKTSDAPAAEAADAAPTAPAFGTGVTFAALPQDLDAMCVWDGDAVVCAPVTNDKG